MKAENLIAALAGAFLVYIAGDKKETSKPRKENHEANLKSYVEGYEDAKKDYQIKD